MPALNITKTYADTQILSESDLDNIKNSVENFLNVTKLDSTNIQANGIATSNLADNAVTALKLDETDDYEMESLLLGDATGPTLSKADTNSLLVEDQIQLNNTTDGPILSQPAANRLLIDDELQLDNSTDGPIFSRDAANRVLVQQAIRLGSGTGPIMENSSGDLLVSSGNLSVTDGNITLNDITISRSAAATFDLQGLSNLRFNSNAQLTDKGNHAIGLSSDSGTDRGNLALAPEGFRDIIQRGSETVAGSSSDVITFPTSFASTGYNIVITITSGGTSGLVVTGITKSTGGGCSVNFSASWSGTYDYIAVGPYF